MRFFHLLRIALISAIAMNSTNAQTIVNFTEDTDSTAWHIVDDVVMGGRSSGSFQIEHNNHAKFSGKVSLENNGGFSAVKHDLEITSVTSKSCIRICLKGDGKAYQFRVKSIKNQRHSYITTIQTTGDWQEVVIPLKDLYPTFRGNKLDLPNFNHNSIAEIWFLIGNKKAETFQLLLKSIEII